MPRSKIVSREEILKAAAEIVRKEGEQALSVRAVAGELNCSTQPVYSVFGGMEELRAELLEEAKRQYHVRIEAYLNAAKCPRYEAFGMGYVRFAREEKGLYRFLFLSERNADLIDPFFDDIVAEMCALYHMSEETARAFHRDMAVFSYGLGALVNTGRDYSDEEIAAAFTREFYALYALYFPERERLGGGISCKILE